MQLRHPKNGDRRLADQRVDCSPVPGRDRANHGFASGQSRQDRFRIRVRRRGVMDEAHGHDRHCLAHAPRSDSCGHFSWAGSGDGHGERAGKRPASCRGELRGRAVASVRTDGHRLGDHGVHRHGQLWIEGAWRTRRLVKMGIHQPGFRIRFERRPCRQARKKDLAQCVDVRPRRDWGRSGSAPALRTQASRGTAPFVSDRWR